MKRVGLYNILTLGPLGYLPGGGTLASLLMWPVVVVFRFMLPFHVFILVACIVALMTYVMLERFRFLFVCDDPSEIVLDECAGAFFSVLFPFFSAHFFMLSLVFFRIFDIFKPGVIKHCEQYPGALGILADDIAAGMCSSLLIVFGKWLEIL